MKTVLLIYNANWMPSSSIEALSEYLYQHVAVRVLSLATLQPEATDIRLWDMSTLTKIEFAEVKRLIEEYRERTT